MKRTSQASTWSISATEICSRHYLSSYNGNYGRTVHTSTYVHSTWVILSKMEDINNKIDPENQVSYGRSTRGNEVMIVSLSSDIRFESLSTNISKRRRITVEEQHQFINYILNR